MGSFSVIKKLEKRVHGKCSDLEICLFVDEYQSKSSRLGSKLQELLVIKPEKTPNYSFLFGFNYISTVLVITEESILSCVPRVKFP